MPGQQVLSRRPILDVLDSRPVVGIVLLRLGRYAVAVLRGNRLLATKTDTRYVKNRHRKGGSSQRRFERSRERLVRELYDTTCRMTRSVFEPHLREIDYVMLGGERGTLNGFVKRCRLMQDLEPKTLSRHALQSTVRTRRRWSRSPTRFGRVGLLSGNRRIGQSCRREFHPHPNPLSPGSSPGQALRERGSSPGCVAAVDC